MTRDEIINLALEAGFNPGNYMGGNLQIFKRFAALVAAAEREECAKVAEDRKDDCFFGEADYYEAERIARAIRNRG